MGRGATGRDYEIHDTVTVWRWSWNRLVLVCISWVAMIWSECALLITAVKRDRRLGHAE